MKRLKKQKKVDLILTADWHLREDQPICRTDDFWAAQWNKIDQITVLQKEHNCPILHAGDLFHHWKPSPWLLSTAKNHMPDQFFTIYGQHDLPQHNFELRHKSGIYDMEVSGFVEVLLSGNWGQSPGILYMRDTGTGHYLFSNKNVSHTQVALWHHFVWDGKKIPWPDCDELTAMEVLKKYPEFDLIVTGDHHKPFVQEYKGRLLVNCGCLTRQASDYANHKPRVWLWEASSNTVVPHFLEVDKNVVSRKHLEKQEERSGRVAAFISRLSDDYTTSVSFEKNIDRFIKKNKLKKKIVSLIYKAIDS